MEVYYRMALAEIDFKVESYTGDRPIKWESLKEVARLMFLEGVSLNKACLAVGSNTAHLRRKYIFPHLNNEERTAAYRKKQKGNGGKVYTPVEKISVVMRIKNGESFAEVTRTTGINYQTLQRWALQFKSGSFTLDNAKSFGSL